MRQGANRFGKSGRLPSGKEKCRLIRDGIPKGNLLLVTTQSRSEGRRNAERADYPPSVSVFRLCGDTIITRKRQKINCYRRFTALFFVVVSRRTALRGAAKRNLLPSNGSRFLVFRFPQIEFLPDAAESENAYQNRTLPFFGQKR